MLNGGCCVLAEDSAESNRKTQLQRINVLCVVSACRESLGLLAELRKEALAEDGAVAFHCDLLQLAVDGLEEESLGAWIPQQRKNCGPSECTNDVLTPYQSVAKSIARK